MTYRDDLDGTLDLFLGMLRDFLGERLVSLLLHGLVVFDDLAPGYGDLDFLAVVDLTEPECQGLIALRAPLRDGTHGILAAMLEGAFLPRKMLDPSRSGEALWWGTTGERVWARNQLGWLTLPHSPASCSRRIRALRRLWRSRMSRSRCEYSGNWPLYTARSRSMSRYATASA